jgi:(R)-2-hydroxyacyl-CoA dehydratese activating ATPase
MLTLGIDIGSASSKAVLLEGGNTVVAQSVVEAGTGTSGRARVISELFEKAHVSWTDLALTVATGYGRASVKEADRQISEITCHARGIVFLRPSVRTVIDIGGQDAKAISLDERGEIKNFFMNDKCAAGTGRFLENMSRVLEIKMADMAQCYFRSTHPAHVSSTCAVFAESEIISLLSDGIARDDIVAGVHNSIAVRACALANRAGVVDDVVMCGGVARDAGAVDAIGRKLGKTVYVPPNPQLTGALGAAVLAYEFAKRNGVKK